MVIYGYIVMFDDVVSCVIMFNGCSNPTVLRVQAEEHVDIIKPSLPVDQLTTQMALRCIKKKSLSQLLLKGSATTQKSVGLELETSMTCQLVVWPVSALGYNEWCPKDRKCDQTEWL